MRSRPAAGVVVPVPSRHAAVREQLAVAAAGWLRTYPEPPADRAEWLARLRGAGTVLHFFDDGRLPTDVLLAAGPRRVVVAGPAGGCLDRPALEAAGITVLDTPGAAAPAVAEHTVGLLLRAARHAPDADWDRPAPAGVELGGATLGLVGFGRIARVVARIAQGIGMHVQVASDHLQPAEADRLGVRTVALPQLMAGSDAVSVHLRADGSTAGRLDAARLWEMSPGTIFVNTSRASVVDMRELRIMVAGGRLRRVALDVFDVEPLPADDLLRNHPAVIVTPHLAWLTDRTVERMTAAALMHCGRPAGQL